MKKKEGKAVETQETKTAEAIPMGKIVRYSNGELTSFEEKIKKMILTLREQKEENKTSLEQVNDANRSPDDAASVSQSKERLQKEAHQIDVLLKEADKALTRIHNKTYGFCESSICGGQRIPKERLDAFPLSRCCCSCQEAREKAPRSRY